MKMIVYIIIVILATVQLTYATTFTFNTSDSQFDAGIDNQGWSSATLSNLDNNAVYAAGDSGGGHILRNFFTFDLSGLNLLGQQVTSVTLDLQRNFYFGDASETIQFFDVVTAPAVLNNNVGTSLAIFNDLGTGTTYGSFAISSVGNTSDRLSFLLNSAALVDVAAAAGGFFSIGGDCTTCTTSQLVTTGFPGHGLGIQSLIIETQAIPEPSGKALWSSGFGLFVLTRVRRRAGAWVQKIHALKTLRLIFGLE